MPMQNAEQDIVRELARQVAALAADPANERIKKRWRDVNALRKPDRAPVWCKPIAAWKELVPDSELKCKDRFLRNTEAEFRRILVKRDIGDDTPIESTYDVQAVFKVHPANVWGVDIRHQSSTSADGAWGYVPALPDWADMDKLAKPVFTYDRATTQAQCERVHGVLGDILPVQVVCSSPLQANLAYLAAELRGLTQYMLDTMDSPERLHQLLGYLRDGVLDAMHQVEATALLTPNTNGPMTCSDPIGNAQAEGCHTHLNCWCLANSQECDQISPAMWQEFCLDYQKPIFEKCGLVQYGCCENLTNKIDGVLSIPNLRVFVCSAWTDLNKVIERVGCKHTIMWRQKASDVVFAADTDGIQRHLMAGARRLQGHYYQVVLRELQTLAGHPRRLHVWTQCAIEAAERYA